MRNIFLLSVLFITTCSGQPKKDKIPSPLVDLDESTQIIRAVISNNQLGELLQEHDEKQLSLILDNFSPAQLAYASEVRASTVPLLMLYFFRDSPQERAFIKQLSNLAQKYIDHVKFVLIDVEKLYMIAHELGVEKTPDILLLKDNNLIFDIEENITIDALENAIKNELLAAPTFIE